MRTQRLIELALFCPLVFPALLHPQMAPGRLQVSSEPPGAIVTIDNRQMPRPTDATYVVFPGNHTVSVTGKDQTGKAIKCTASLNISSGVTKSVNCTARGWDPPVR
jgi:hypothetical protein